MKEVKCNNSDRNPINIEFDRSDETLEDKEVEVFRIEEVFKQAGGFGMFQWIYCSIATILFMPAGVFIYNQNFLTLKQVMMCPNPAGGSWLCEEGDREIDPCHNGEFIEGVYADFSNPKSLHNWITELDMFCLPPFRISLFGALYFTGILFGMTILAITSKYGRRINLIVSSWAMVGVTILLVVVSNLYARYFGMFLLGVLMIQKITTYIVAIELTPFKNQIAIATVILAVDNATFAVTSLYFKFISDDWRYLGYFAIGFSLLCAIGSLFLPESPRFLVEKGDYTKARAIFNRMATMNKADLNLKHWKFSSEASSKSQSTFKKQSSSNSISEELLTQASPNSSKDNPFKYVISNPKLGISLLIVTISWIACSFNYYLISYDIKNLGGNLFINAIIISIASVVGTLITLCFRKYFSSKISLIACFSVVLVFGFGLIIFREGWIVSLCVAMVLMGLGGAFTLVYFVNNEYFPPLFLGFAFSVTQFGSRGMTIMSYLMSDLEEPIPMIILCGITGMALVSLVFLRKPDVNGRCES